MGALALNMLLWHLFWGIGFDYCAVVFCPGSIGFENVAVAFDSLRVAFEHVAMASFGAHWNLKCC